MEGRKAPGIERQGREQESHTLPPVRGCVGLWRRGAAPGTLRRLRAVWDLCGHLEAEDGLSLTGPLRAEDSGIKR